MNDATHGASTDAAPLPQLVDAKAAAAALCIGERLLRSLTVGRELPSVRIGRRVLYDSRDLADFIERNRRERRG